MSAGPNPVDRLEQAATQFKDSGVIQLAVQGLLLEGVARDLRRCDAATAGCVELSAWLNRGIRELERRKRIVDAQITLIGTRHRVGRHALRPLVRGPILDRRDGRRGMMDDERRKAILLALACLAILILLIIECAIMPRMGWLWIITAALDLVLLAMCVRHIIRGGRK